MEEKFVGFYDDNILKFLWLWENIMECYLSFFWMFCKMNILCEWKNVNVLLLIKFKKFIDLYRYL